MSLQIKKPTLVSEDGLDDEPTELIRLFEAALATLCAMESKKNSFATLDKLTMRYR